TAAGRRRSSRSRAERRFAWPARRPPHPRRPRRAATCWRCWPRPALTLTRTPRAWSWPTGAGLVDCPVLGSVPWLAADCRGDEALGALLACSHLASLAALDLRYSRIGDAGAAALASCPHLTALESLELEDNRIGDAGLAALADAPDLTRLAYLGLRKNRFAS